MKHPPREPGDSEGSSDEEDERPAKKLGKLRHLSNVGGKDIHVPKKSSGELSEPEDYLTVAIEGLDDDFASKENLTDMKEVPLAKRLPKGLHMMEKMGYTAEQSLDLTSQGDRGIIPVHVKRDRLGIRVSPVVTQTRGSADSDDFRKRIKDEKNTERKEGILLGMQKLAFTMTEEIDSFNSETDPRDFNVLLRGYVIQLLQKMKSETPKDEHFEVAERLSTPVASIDDELEMFNLLSIDEKITKLNTFLRTELRYCFHCGNKYKDDADLFAHCPGFTEEDHQ